MMRAHGAAFLLLLLLVCALGVKYSHCPLQEGPERRELYVATCDTRAGWKEFNALKVRRGSIGHSNIHAYTPRRRIRSLVATCAQLTQIYV